LRILRLGFEVEKNARNGVVGEKSERRKKWARIEGKSIGARQRMYPGHGNLLR